MWHNAIMLYCHMAEVAKKMLKEISLFSFRKAPQHFANILLKALKPLGLGNQYALQCSL